MLVRLSGRFDMEKPLQIFRVMPLHIPSIPRVAINGGTLNRLISSPLIMPGIRLIRRPAIQPTRILVDIEAPELVSSWISLPQSTELIPIINPMDKSIPPVITTNVSAAARSNGPVARWSIFWKFVMLRNPDPTILKMPTIRIRKKKAQL
jgi:hypothetical protein